MDKDYEKQKGPGTSGQSFFRLQNKCRKVPLLVMYCLTKFDGLNVIWSRFWVIPKITSADLCKPIFCKPIFDIVNYFTLTSPFESGMCGKEGKKEKKLNL